MRDSFGFETENYEISRQFELDLLSSDFEAGLFGEFESSTPCAPFIPVAAENPGGERVKNKTAPSSSDIVMVKNVYGSTTPLHRLAAAALEAMICAARADGIEEPLFRPTSGFRDPKRQAELWADALRKYGSPEEARKWVAPPGGSAHQSGRAIDLYLGGKNSSSNVANLRKLPAYLWLVANARRFGFYPYEREPWHWEYNPPPSGQSEFFAGLYEDEDVFEDEGIGPVDGLLEQFERGEPAVATAPKLIGHEPTPPGRTLYVSIPLGGEHPARPMTGIFIPHHFQPRPRVDLIIFLHGIKPRANLSIDALWNRNNFPFLPLREGLNQSRRNVVLVAPTLGPRPENQSGWLTEAGGLDKYVDQVLAAVAAHGPYKRAGQQPQIGDIILAAHAGGGLLMRKLALGKNRYAGRIRECWGFDCLSVGGDGYLWAQWAKSRPHAKLYIYFHRGTREQSERLREKRIPNIFISHSPAAGHNWVPIHHWRERLESAAPLRNRQGITGPGLNEEWSWGSIGDWFSRWGSASPQPSQSPAQPPAQPPTVAPGTYVPAQPSEPPASDIRTNAVALANQEWNRWGRGSIKEKDPRMRPVLEDYWLTGTGKKRPEPNWWDAVPWSAAFISWLMRKAGAGNHFKYSASHSDYIVAAKENSIAQNSNPFKAYRVNEVKPRLGDLVCKDRGSGATYDNIRSGMTTHCDVVTAIEPNRLTTIGGNLSDSVSATTNISTDANGYITTPGYFAVIRVGAS
jgi:Uncharacterized protein conserved in bacteria (DUF2272)/D-alanyl-D-alanine carboxypeptidase